MAKKRRDEELFQKLRVAGLRKRVAGAVAEASDRVDPRKLAGNLRSVADDLEDRAKGGPRKRATAAKKAASTRAANARKRSASGKKAAATRASGNGSTRTTKAKPKAPSRTTAARRAKKS